MIDYCHTTDSTIILTRTRILRIIQRYFEFFRKCVYIMHIKLKIQKIFHGIVLWNNSFFVTLTSSNFTLHSEIKKVTFLLHFTRFFVTLPLKVKLKTNKDHIMYTIDYLKTLHADYVEWNTDPTLNPTHSAHFYTLATFWGSRIFIYMLLFLFMG